MFALVACFVFQTWLVYADPAGTEYRLSAEAIEGQDIWRRKNCQSCHQLFGFGGFLGPDLTNAMGALSEERLDSILTVGAGQMPAFHLDGEQQGALRVYLTEMDMTGKGQPLLGEVLAPAELLSQLTETAAGLASDVQRGREIVLAQNCIACHLPNEQSLQRSADLTTLVSLSGHDKILTVLHDGVAGTAMPRLGLSPADGEAVFAFLGWLQENGDGIRSRFQNLATSSELRLSRVPWFEYE
jgi:nitric oxide reductase subunit C